LKSVFVIGAALVALAGCNRAYLAQQAFPDRTLYAFNSNLAEGPLTYSCQQGPTEEDTIKRANQAHRAFEAAVIDFADTQSQQMIAGLRAGETPRALSRTLDGQGNAWAETTITRIEENYQCLALADL
jgi:hypothetical protein